ncbi:MAG: PT domain-containing protein, partial [Ruminococcus sp.]|nr:PT domain-containing protein [Ruminococcus sp.]
MLKTRKLISLLLVVAMMLSVFSVAIVSASAADGDAATTASEKAIVHISGLDGKVETKEFNVGDDFYVYTTLNASQINEGKIGSINARQLYTNSVVKLIDEYTENDGILELQDVFPITQYATMASGHHTDLTDDEEYHDPTRGAIFYNASIASYRGFRFDDDDDILIKSHYQITNPGEAYITNEVVTLACSDEDLTRIIDRGVIVRDNFRLHASSLAPELQPTEAPTEAPVPTEAPTEAPEPTEAPTEAPVPTEAPTEPAPEDTYIVAGNTTDIFGTSWNGNDANNTMTKGDGGIYTKQYTVDGAMKDVQLKAVKNGETWIGDETGNNVTFNL